VISSILATYPDALRLGQEGELPTAKYFNMDIIRL